MDEQQKTPPPLLEDSFFEFFESLKDCTGKQTSGDDTTRVNDSTHATNQAIGKYYHEEKDTIAAGTENILADISNPI